MISGLSASMPLLFNSKHDCNSTLMVLNFRFQLDGKVFNNRVNKFIGS